MAEYIEREAMLQEIDRAFKEYGQDGDILKLFSECRASILFAPTADVVEVRHGEWQEKRWCDNFQHICSLCHKTARVHPQSVAYKYCPYCGAKMDGGSKDV